MNKDQKRRARREKRQDAYRARRKRRPNVVDPRWNMDKEKGPIVTGGEVAIYALDGHPPCMRRPGWAGKVLCRCAQRRFFEANKDRIIIDERVRLWWIEGKQPGAKEKPIPVLPVEPEAGPSDADVAFVMGEDVPDEALDAQERAAREKKSLVSTEDPPQ